MSGRGTPVAATPSSQEGARGASPRCAHAGDEASPATGDEGVAATTLHLTVTDAGFFPGTVAAVNALLAFHPGVEICVVDNHLDKRGLDAAQHAVFEDAGVRVVRAEALARPGRKLAAWELKAYAAADLPNGHEALAGFDSDCVVCGPVGDVVAAALATGAFHGGRDGTAAYDETYRVYGIEPPARNERYFSTSLYVCALTEANRRVLARWAECCDRAKFGGGGVFPGHGDQGVLNAVLFAERREDSAQVLENRLWSQHHCYWQGHVAMRGGVLFNEDAQMPQRSIHCGGAEKFWTTAHRDRVEQIPQHAPSFGWFLRHLWFGKCEIQPRHLAAEHRHLAESLVRWRHLVRAFDVPHALKP